MGGGRVAGLAAIVSEMDPALIDELAESRMPVVFYDVGTPKRNITNIRVNYKRGMEKVIELRLTTEEKALLAKSAEAVKGLVDGLPKG